MMKVLLVNGSPRIDGCTNRALEEVQNELIKEGIDAIIFHIGNKSQRCIACGRCKEIGYCVFEDKVNEFANLAKEADGFIFGSPVYYASATGGMISFMDRLFCSSSRYLVGKPAASVVVCRRDGSTETFSQLNKYYTINNMPVISSQYWNQVFGNTKEEVEKDIEGLQTMRVLARNMAWILKCIEAGYEKGIKRPTIDKKIRTNFIR